MARKAYWVRNTASSNIFRLDGSATTPFGFPLPHNWIDLKSNFVAGVSQSTCVFKDVATPINNPDYVWVVGTRKTFGTWSEKGVAHSKNAGNTWIVPVVPDDTAFITYGSGGNSVPTSCNKVMVVDDDTIYIGCDNGFVLKCTNGSTAMPVFTIVARINEPIGPGSNVAQSIQSIHFSTPLLGAVGLKDAVYYTINGGVTWTKVSNDLKFKLSSQPPNPSPSQRNWEINGIVGIYIETVSSLQTSTFPCGDPQLGSLVQTNDISIRWAATNGSGVIVNTGGLWNSYRCFCPCNVRGGTVGSPGYNYPCCDSSLWGSVYQTATLYPLSHLAYAQDDGLPTAPGSLKKWQVISGSINQLYDIQNGSYGGFGTINTTQFPTTSPSTTRDCVNGFGITIPANNTTTRWNSASAWYRTQPAGSGISGLDGFILYNDGPNGITIGYQDFSTSYTEVVSQNWPWSYSGFGTTPASYPVQQPVGTIWVAGEDEPVAVWQLTPCVYNPITPTVYTTADLTTYDDTVITDFYINNQLTSQCYTVAGPLQNYNGSLTSVVVDPALVTVYPVSTTPAPGACYYCGIGCYKLIECGNPNNVQYVFSTNQATIDLLVGSLYQTIQSPQICDNKCFYLTRCTGLPTNPILLDTVLQNQSLQLTAYVSCAECLGVAPDLEPKPRAVKPGFYTPGCPPEYTVKTSSMYAEQVYDEMVSIRYGINICCDHDIDKWDIKKQLLEFKAIYDDCACETTLNPCPTCVPPCNVTAEATSYVIYEPPPPPPPCLLPTQVNIGITTSTP